MNSVPRTIYLLPAHQVRPVVTVQRQRVVAQCRPAPQKSHLPVLVARPVTPKRPAADLIDDILGDDSIGGPPRKRERLTHLTPEQKLDRRKMKNRVAAQTARDRKKVRSQKLEDVVHRLLAENERLREENLKLRAQQHQLMKVESTSEEKTFESAAFINAPLPRVQVNSQTIALLIQLLLSAATFSNNTKSIVSFKNSRTTSTSTSSPANSRLSLEKSSKSRHSTMRRLLLKLRRAHSRRVP